MNLYLVLDLIFVDPKHQRRGAGSELVKWGADQADQMGGEAFVESTPFGRRLYEQNGFQVMEDITLQVPDKWAHKPAIQHLFMRRPAMKGVVQ
jgi:GNAT superfamily N-acetyltransferase